MTHSHLNSELVAVLQVFNTFSFSSQDISCIKELTSLYEAATIEDIYVAYEELKIDENSLFSCIGIAGVNAGEDISGKLV